MTILPVSGLINYSVKPLTFKGVNNSVAPQSDKHVTTKDIPYSYPISFKGKEVDMKQRLEDSNWAKGVFEYYGMEPEIDPKDGLLIISEFRDPTESLRYKDSGIDVNRLVKNVKKIKGDGNFRGDQYKNLCVPNLEEVEGALWCVESENMEFPKLKSVKDIIDCSGAKSIKFPSLKTAKMIDCWHAKSVDLSSVEDVQNIDCRGAKSIKLPEKIIEKFNVPRDYIAA